MKLADHVDSLRELIEAAFDKQFARLGFGKSKQTDSDKLPEDARAKRERFIAMLESHIGETGCYESAREKLIDELTFTLFNRLAAIKVMEAANLFPPILTKQKEHGDRSFGHKAWLEMNPDMRGAELEGIRDYLKTAFDELGNTLPLYSKAYPYSLLPDAVSLNDIIDAFNLVEQDAQVDGEIWGSDDVLGWMYESYNNKKKQAHKESKEKTEYNKVSLQSQVYTPRWVVQFLVENSLGKMYLEMYPDSEIKRRYKIANAPQSQTRKRKPLHEIRTIDPACGSGNFLLYAFDFYYALYLDQIDNYGAEYDVKDIPKLIIENNLHGIDLDDRAVQLAQLGLFIKAKKKRRNVGEMSFRIVSSDFYLPDFSDVKHIFEQGKDLDQNQKELIEKIWNDLKYAYKFGSLVHIEEQLNAQLHQIESRESVDLFAAAEMSEHRDFATNFFANLTKAVQQFARTDSDTFLVNKTRDAVTFLELLTTEYDVATANPPYTDSSDFGPDLKEFIEENYRKPYRFNTNLYATFIKRCCELTNDDGKVAMVHPPTFMYIKTFEDVRRYMIEKTGIDLFIEWGYLGMFHPSARVDAAMYVLDKKQKNNDSTFIKLNHIYEGQRYEAFVEAYENLINGVAFANNYAVPQSKLKIIKTWPFIYWISDEFRAKFKDTSVKDQLKNCQGLATANNNRFLRFWWELSDKYSKIDHEKWPTYAKGGPYKKWTGNLWLKVNWENDGEAIRGLVDDNGRQRSRTQNEDVYFKQGITYSASGSKGPSYRLLPEESIFDVGGSSIFPIKEFKNNEYVLAFFNTKFVSYVANCLNPTVNMQVGDIERIPFVIPDELTEVEISKLSSHNILISKYIDSKSLFDSDFAVSPLEEKTSIDWMRKIKEFLDSENFAYSQMLINDAQINERILDVYELTWRDREMLHAEEGPCVAKLPIDIDARDAFLDELELSQNITRDFVSSLETKEFKEDHIFQVESNFPSLYQSNNDLEAFCIQNQVNPINVWHWFREGSVIPNRRMITLAMEFLADIVRELLMQDEDGIIPLVPNAGEKILLDRIEEKFLERGFSASQFSSFDRILGRPIGDYLNEFFFADLSDHLNLFMYLPKTPFVWHLSSGPERGFDCYIIIYKWNRDKLLRLSSVYIENRERALINRQRDLVNQDSTDAQNEKDKIFKQLREIEIFRIKIDELLADGYDPILDDGVGKNIAPLQKKKMLAYDVLNHGQLEKYLNADW